MTESGSSDVETVAGVDVLVTGAGRGLGRGVARAMAAAGARVWLVSEVREELEWTASDIRAAGGEAHVFVADLGREDARRGLVDTLRERAPGLRVIVNNAGVLEREPVASLDAAHWRRIMSVNLEAPVFLTRDLLPVLRDEGGSVINVSSRAGTGAFARQTAYCASKFGVEAFTRCLALELDGSPISINTVTPGLPIKPTSLTRRDAERTDAATRARWRDPVKLGPAFLFLAGLRGQISGCRFDAWTLTRALEQWGARGVMNHVPEIAEYAPTESTHTESAPSESTGGESSPRNAHPPMARTPNPNPEAVG